MTNAAPKGLTPEETTHSWNAIKGNLGAQSTPFSFLAFWKRTQSKATAVALGVLILTGGAATASADSARPGDFLFPIEVAKEKTQILLSLDQKQKEALRIKFAEKRLAEVRALALESQSTVLAASTTAATATATTSSKNEEKKIARTERAITIALAQLTETRQTLSDAGNNDAALIIDDIMSELKGVGDGRALITHISGNGNGNGKITLRATLTASSSATSTFAGIVRIDEKKNGAKITLNSDSVKTQIIVGGNTKEKKDHDGDDQSEKNDDNNHEGKNNDDDEHGDNGGKKVPICHRTGDGAHTITVAVNAARAHLSHGDVLGRCKEESSDDTAAPTITQITSTPSITNVTITWATNEGARTRLWLSTSSPVSTSGAPTLEETGFTTSHSVLRSSLTPATTYHFVLVATDAAGNRATSSEWTFTTNALPVVDTTPPIISGIVIATTTTGATINWNTNELASGILYFGTTSPVDFAGSQITISALTTTKAALLSGLSASSTYHVVITAKDSVGNTATSSPLSFVLP